MADLLDNCRFVAGSSGTNDFADGAASAGCRNLEDAGAVDGAVYPYKAQNATATQWERGYATFDEGSGTLVRNDILDSSDGGNKVDFSTNPVVIISPSPAYFVGRAVVQLADTATPDLDASLGNVFRLEATGNRVIAVPSHPRPGQKIVIQHYASGGARTLGLNTGAGGFRFGVDIPALTETASGKTDYIGAIYNSAANFWDIVAYAKGY